MTAGLLRSPWLWEAARLPFNLLLVMYASVAFEPMFAQRSWQAYLYGVPAADPSWSDVVRPDVLLALAWANIFYCLIYPLDACLQKTRLQRRDDIGRAAIWMGLSLFAAMAVFSRVSFIADPPM